MNREQLQKYVLQCLIIGFWVALLACVLRFEWPTEECATDKGPACRVLRILSWPDIFDKEYIRKFEEQYGVTVQLSSYTSNEELLVKLRAAQGRGYDLIMPSDYAVTILRDEGLLKRLRSERIAPHVARLNPLLKSLPHDPEQEYSLPYEWEVFGIAYSKDFFAHHPLRKSWGALFDDPHGAYKIIMSNDPREPIRAAAYYRYGPVDELTAAQMDSIETLLKRQHSWVAAYSSTNLDYYLISGYGVLSFASSAYVGRRKFFAHKIGFFVPDEGGLVTIENFAIPLHAEAEDLVYDFIDFIYTPESLLHHHELFTFFPATTDLLDSEHLDPAIRALVGMPEAAFRKLIPIKQLMPEERMIMLWLTMKA